MSENAPPTPLDDVLAEGGRLVKTADAAGIRLRLLGGAAFGLHIHQPIPDRLRRTYGDLDVAVGSKQAQALGKLLPTLGYKPDERFNALHGEKRFLFRDLSHERKLDVFIGSFSMCHKMDLEGRLPERGLTLAAADLLLTKLQIVELNEKDTIDVLVLLAGHDLVPGGGDDVIDLDRISAMCGNDWGWWATVGDNLPRLGSAAPRLLEPADSDVVGQRCVVIRGAIEETSKSRAWRLRAMIGRRMEWYMLPEEVG